MVVNFGPFRRRVVRSSYFLTVDYFLSSDTLSDAVKEKSLMHLKCLSRRRRKMR